VPAPQILAASGAHRCRRSSAVPRPLVRRWPDRDIPPAAAIQVEPVWHDPVIRAAQRQPDLGIDPWGAVDLSLFATNLLNKAYYTSIAGIWASGGFEARYPAEPRMVGVRLRVNFGA
jgi:hypothetical protein